MCSEIVTSYYLSRVIMRKRGLLEVLLYGETHLIWQLSNTALKCQLDLQQYM
jgi:hypothetical protein